MPVLLVALMGVYRLGVRRGERATSDPGPNIEPTPDKAPEQWFNFLGLTIIRKADLLAAAAFILALSTALYQLVGFLNGAKVRLYHPETVYIYFDTYANGMTLTRIAGQVSFTNAGEVGANAVLRDLSVVITLGNLRFEEFWLTFAKVTRSETRLDVEPQSSAHPLVISGGSANSELVSFAPRIRVCDGVKGVETPNAKCEPRANYVIAEQFLNALSEVKTVALDFTGHIVEDSAEFRSRCVVQVTSETLTTMAENNWFGARCITMR